MSELENPLVKVLMTSEAVEEMAEANTEAQALVGLELFPNDTPQDIQDLDALLSMVQARLRRLDEEKEKIAGPMAKAKSALDALFRNARAPYEAAKEVIKGKIQDYETRRLQLRAEALAAVSEAVQAGDRPVAVAAHAMAAQASVATPASISYEWEWELEDITQVPPEYLALNAVTMKMHAAKFRKSETIEGIPGVRFRRVPKVRAR